MHPVAKSNLKTEGQYLIFKRSLIFHVYSMHIGTSGRKMTIKKSAGFAIRMIFLALVMFGGVHCVRCVTVTLRTRSWVVATGKG